ncbi:MAG: polymerase subunit sigma [Hydrocarboniphaga sp.]|uniref:SIR2 family NAD-dependent protein deacylase n=1 Tax=Hydrocarboniphaga sp. TaxID=2033016 RepID=UPI002637EF0E|nr:Sir2 family NAD-dependent protein deacetylase [Hydrocarboniphaga sp.]MDB5969781.1 polymerase subunit sigma [Hydrocarboniphaga sp.]
MQISISEHSSVVFFTGAGLSAESGVPTYRGAGGIWAQYRYEDYACQRAFDRDPQRVLHFHELRRASVLACAPHAGHAALAAMQAAHPRVQVVTQNIDGMLQRAGVRVDAELHGSMWRMRCTQHGIRDDFSGGAYASRKCEHCAAWLRPDITWFEDSIDEAVFARAGKLISECSLFVAVGTSAVVYPAAAFVPLAKRSGAQLVEINPETTEASSLFDRHIALPASQALTTLFV